MGTERTDGGHTVGIKAVVSGAGIGGGGCLFECLPKETEKKFTTRCS